MDYKQTVDILSDNIKDLENIIAGFREAGKISAIEIDLLMDKTRSFYDVLLLMRQNALRIQGGKAGKAVETEHGTQKAVEDSAEEGEPVKGMPHPDRDATSFSGMQASGSEKAAAGQITSKKSEFKTLSDTFSKPSSSLHDSLSGSKTSGDLTAKLQLKPIGDIGEAIGLNDKFAFIHELFRGDTKKYDETIKTVNAASNFNEAYNFLIENFDWDMDNPLVQKILDLIRRKFITGKK